MKEWGEKGVTATTSEEAEALWKKVKKEEKAELGESFHYCYINETAKGY